ncbi:hypothetical protein G7009_01605 [Pseudomonas capeferrum]|uniref:hypothetical protein n=1 Tax=Pseudomonas capeferrum TaxID=1495066 RepID=UPI0015E3D1C9|nr:hypothetical protein [Pseudomonas capeferrum]MBA1200499.1 hypothetical protein [Pseudomonas capeferrum]
MIGENIPDQHEQARRDLGASVARFLAEGGQIQQCTGAGSVPREPNLRSYPAPQPQAAQIDRKLLDQARQAAKTMTLSEACAQLGVSRTTLHHLSKQHGFLFRVNTKQKAERDIKRQARTKARAELVDKIRTYAHTSLSRDAVAKLLGISHQQLSKLAKQHDIDFPKWRRPA